ncbi:TolB family protein [Longimicrobium sp.]|uniref:TolB family protein n=1 Tax=Longimicrobium sp. TaxID=2029185 RepID=UPI003B3AD2FD
MSVRPQFRRGARLAIAGLFALGAAACEDLGVGSGAEREDRIVFVSNREVLDSATVLYPPTDVFVMNADGTGVQNLTHGPDWDFHSSVSVSPDGGRIAFASDRATPGCAQIFTMHTDGSARAQVTTEHCNYVPRWSPDGTRLAYLSLRAGRVAVFTMNANGTSQRDLSTATLAGAAGCTATQPPTVGLLGWVPGGRVTFYHHRCGVGYRYFVAPGDGTGAVAQLDYDAYAAYWSPDGARVAFIDWHGGVLKLHVMNADGSNLRVLTTDEVGDGLMPRVQAIEVNPWSPDGTRLVFSRHLYNGDGTEQSGMYVVNADGSGLRRLPLDHATDFNGWSPRGDRLAFSVWEQPGRRDVYVVNADGTGLTNLTNNPADDHAIGWVRGR